MEARGDSWARGFQRSVAAASFLVGGLGSVAGCWPLLETSFGIGIWAFAKIEVPYFGALIIRILLSRALYEGPPLSETPI